MVRRKTRVGPILMLGGAPRATLTVGVAACCGMLLSSRSSSAQDTATIATTTQNYTTPALRELVTGAVRANARIPAGLRGYRATIETEMSTALRDSAEQERTTQLEQIASEVRWRAPDRYDQHVVGYRSQTLGPTFSLMSIFGGWTTPILYGNRLRLGVTPVSSRRTTARATRDVSLAIHPLSEARDAYYRYSGGDTVATLATRTRRIPVIRLNVEPKEELTGDAILFSGEVDLDADRRQVVRMRGRMIEVRGGQQTTRSGSRVPGASGASFVELINAEVDGLYWLPAYQRTELQAAFAWFGNFRATVRIVSRFRDHRVNDSTWTTPPDTIPALRVRHTLSFAPAESLSRYATWDRPIGEASEDARVSDFEDVAPPSWRPTGRSSLRFWPRAISDVFRFNRVEGVFTGVSAEYDFRDASPGTRLRANGGWAWAERTARGALILERSRIRWSGGFRVDRTLAHTNDFRLPFAPGATWSAILGSADDFDYLDRRSASAYVARTLGLERRVIARLEIGAARDDSVIAHVSRGLFKGDSSFRDIRGIHEGGYVRSVATLEWNPQVSALFLDRGIGGRLRYDRADGTVRWQRIELRAVARRELGPMHLMSRIEGGVLIGAIAPQALFEIGREEGLSSYDYKQFGGDRAAIARTMLLYNFPFFRSPIILPSRLIIPGLAPGVSVGMQGGWAEASSAGAHRALLELGARRDSSTGALVPISVPTNGIRASADVRLTFFSGAASIGFTRAIDQADRWRFVATLGQAF